MDTKICIECNKEYESQSSSGHEQKYCSKSCRYKAANKRRESNMVEKLKREIHPTTVGGNEERKPQEFQAPGFNLSAERIIDLVTTNAYLTAENKRLTEKVTEVNDRCLKLDMEISELEDELQEKDKGESLISGANNLVDKLAPFAPFLVGIFANKKEKTTKDA